MGGHAVDYVEVLHNNRVIHRTDPVEAVIATDALSGGPFKIHFEVGWGQKGDNVDWEVDLAVVGGRLLGVEPRFRGRDVVAPQAHEEESYVFSQWDRRGENGVGFRTRIWGNPATTTSATQGVCLEVDGDAQTRIRGQINGQPVEVSLVDLVEGPRSDYLGHFLTPAYYFQRAVPPEEYRREIDFTHRSISPARDWYYVRVRQLNGQWAWSSPIWVEA